MIIVRLIGGLGNQMFQYAVARHLAEIHKVVLKMDISGFKTYKKRKYSLWPFNIQENFASPEEVAALGGQRRGIVERVVRRVLRKPVKSTPTYIREKRLFYFDADILKLPDGVYLHGSWQNERYFADIAGIIRQEFTVRTPPAGKDKELAEQIASCQSVSLSIRRGDYASKRHTKRVHGTCGLDYYYRCVEHLTQTVKNPHFFIFGDEPQWARDNLKLPYPTTFVDHNAEDKNYEDLRLLSRCKHNIIANSSFSWWGAWLNQDPEKIVLAPKRWFKSDAYDPRDLIPDKWIKV
jgi:hypothetical protein